ncbi:methyl-accepting chemotaxis protein [Magnetospirillum sp. UT-4]|uniref:methyl-accepting chemotaxis protein n=1 Tax=Magnetospirillum sp. UT-4 TaxID=2681467 RepID=UPI0015729C31|nr:methyl-accepting chemotaxis protein [Magnetospirillum sp. UT-4]
METRLGTQFRALLPHGGTGPDLLGNYPIRTRFAVLVGLAVVCAAVIGIAYQVGERRIDAAMAAYDDFRRLNDLAGDVRAKAAQLRNHHEQFLLERDVKLHDAFQADAGFISDALDHMGQGATDEVMAGLVTELKVDLDEVSGHFGRLFAISKTLGLTASAGLRGQLTDSAEAAESELKMWPNAGPLLPAMLQLRLAESLFMLYGGEGYRGQHRRYANEFDFQLDASPLPPSTRDELRTLAKTYAEDMQAFAESSSALAAEAAALRQQFQKMQPDLDKVFAHAREGMAAASREQAATRSRTSAVVSAIAVVSALAFFAATLVLARSVSHPIRQIETAMDALAKGNHDVTVPGIARRDEIGDMAKAVAVFKDNAIAMVRLQQQQEAVRAEAEEAARAQVRALADQFEGAVKTVADIIGDNAVAIRTIAAGMIGGEAAGGDNRSLEVAEAAERSRDTVAAVAKAAGELQASVDEVSRNVGEASGVVRHAVDQLERTNARVQGLSEVAGRIDRVVKLIGDIAGRTNMLSLNATIEAQRAGEAGKGFAVVAEEVKHLAQRTGDSTREIAELVDAIQSATAETVAAIAEVDGAVRRMDDIAGRVAESMARQAEVTRNIGDCVAQVTQATHEVTDGVVNVTQTAARYCGSALQVVWAADDQSGPAASLKHQVDGFLATVRG